MTKHEGSLTAYQIYAVLSILMMTKVCYTSIKSLCGRGGTAAWQISLISVLLALVCYLPIWALMRRFPGCGLNQMAQTVLGRVGGSLFCVAISAFGVYYCAVTLRETSELLKSYHLPNTQLALLMGLTITAAAMLCLFGATGIGRLSALCFPLILAGLALIFLLCLPHYHTANLLPMLGNGIGSTAWFGLLRTGAYGEILFLPVLSSAMRRPDKAGKAGFYAILTGGAVITVFTLVYCMSFHYQISALSLSPLLEMLKRVYFNRFFQRFQAIFLLIFVPSALLCVAICFQATASLFCRACSVVDLRYTLPAFALLIYSAAMLPHDLTDLLEYHLVLLRQYSGIFTFGMPALLLAVAVIRKKKGVLSS